MAEKELANGTDSQLKEMAQKSISSQKADIEKFESFLSKHKTAPGDTAATMRMMQPMRAMMADMHQKGMDQDMNTDQSFARMMIHHHQSGVAMAEEFLQQGKTQEMKAMAQKIIDEQQKEIRELEAWQQQHKK